MCGNCRWRDTAQLALFDAIVFFVAAVLISSLLLSYSESINGSEPVVQHGTSDPSEILSVFLSASVGTPVAVDIATRWWISEDTKVADCLALELEAILGGIGTEAFEQLNAVLLVILERITNPVFQAHLIVIQMDTEPAETILALPSEPVSDTDRRACSTVIPCGDFSCLVELVLC